jgi:N-dimethylarginine dimethylaminohydrolase
MKDKARILMCRPDHFGVTYSINPWMDPAHWEKAAQALADKAKDEWQALHRTLKSLGATIHLVPPVAGLPDLVFTANAAVVMDRTALVARFRHPERQGEEAHYARAFRMLQAAGHIDEVRFMPEGVLLEGAGDCVWDKIRGLYWMGYGPRSDKEARETVEDCFGIETIALELADPRFYHMDTAACPLTGGELLHVPFAFTRDGLGQIHERVAPHLRIEIEEADAVRLAANAVCLGRDIVLSHCSARLRAQLEERGYRVHESPLGSFALSGGSAFCLILRLDNCSERVRRAAAAAAPSLALG